MKPGLPGGRLHRCWLPSRRARRCGCGEGSAIPAGRCGCTLPPSPSHPATTVTSRLLIPSFEPCRESATTPPRQFWPSGTASEPRRWTRTYGVSWRGLSWESLRRQEQRRGPPNAEWQPACCRTTKPRPQPGQSPSWSSARWCAAPAHPPVRSVRSGAAAPGAGVNTRHAHASRDHPRLMPAVTDSAGAPCSHS
jgi:hypothetical protein